MEWKRFEDEKPNEIGKKYVVMYESGDWRTGEWSSYGFLDSEQSANYRLRLILLDPIWWAEVTRPILSKEDYEKAKKKFFNA